MIIADIQDDKEYFLAFDAEEKKPGCVLLQAAYGCPSGVAHLFNVDLWLLSPTPNLKRYRVKGDSLKRIVKMINEQKKET